MFSCVGFGGVGLLDCWVVVFSGVSFGFMLLEAIRVGCELFPGRVRVVRACNFCFCLLGSFGVLWVDCGMDLCTCFGVCY